MANATDFNILPGGMGCAGHGVAYGMPCANPPEWWGTDIDNMDTLTYWRDFLVESALSAFKWNGLEDVDIDPRFIEMTLLFQGMGGFFEKIPGQLAFCSGTVVGVPDMYLNPIDVQFVSVNGTGTWERRTQTRSEADPETGLIRFLEANATWGYDNILRVPLMWHIMKYARRLARFDRVIDMNTSAQATPWVGEANEEAKGDLMRVLTQLQGFEPAIATGNGFLSDTNVHVFNTQAPYVVDKLQDARKQELSVILTMLGIDNVTTEKRERLISTETQGNNEQIMLFRQSRLDLRQRLAEQTNKLFDTNIQVGWNVAYNMDDEVDMGNETFGGVNYIESTTQA